MSPPIAWTPIWLVESDLESAINPATLSACFDDGSGNFESGALLAVIAQAETEVLSYLGDYGPPPFSAAILQDLGTDYFLRSCALEFAKYFVFDRHPEYVRATGKQQDERYKRAQERMVRVLDGRQRPPTATTVTGIVGGAVVDNGKRLYVDSADGTSNSGDY